MKVLEIVDLNPTKFGGFEKYNVGFSKYLSRLGHEHVVFFNGMPCPVFEDELLKVGATCLNRDFNKLGVRDTLFLVKFIFKNRVDVVHLHFYPAYSVFSLLSRFLPYKVFVSYRISGTPHSRAIWVQALKKLRSKVFGMGIDGVFCVSNFAKKKFLHDYQENAEKVSVIHNGLSLEYFNYTDGCDNRSKNQKFRVICVASLIEEKGIEDLLRAVKIVLTRVCSIEVLIVGEGAGRETFEVLAKQLGISAVVSFLGMRSDVPSLLSCADVAVVPSVWDEAFGFTVIEAMAAGLPVIATAVGGIPEIVIHEKTGLLVQRSAPTEIADCLIRLYTNPELRVQFGQQALHRVDDYFNISRVYKQQLNCYEEN